MPAGKIRQLGKLCERLMQADLEGDVVCLQPVSTVAGWVHPLERAAAAAVQRGQLAVEGFDECGRRPVDWGAGRAAG